MDTGIKTEQKEIKRTEGGKFAKGKEPGPGRPLGSKESPEAKALKQFRKKLDKQLPDTQLIGAVKGGLKANKIHGTADDFVEIPDHTQRLKSAQEGFKLKNKYPKEEKGGTTIIDSNILILIEKANKILPE